MGWWGLFWNWVGECREVGGMGRTVAIGDVVAALSLAVMVVVGG